MKVDKKVTQANELLKSGDIEGAKAAFIKILKTKPKDVFSLFSLGLIAMKEDDPNLALKNFDRVLKVNPTFDKAWFNRGVVLYALKRHELAIESYERAIRINPSYVDAYNNRGVVLQEIGKYIEAIKNYDELLQIHPTYDKALANKGFILILTLRYDEAIDCFTKLLEINPEYSFGLGMMSSAQQYACRWEDFDRITNLINEGVRAGKPVTNSLVLMAISDSAADQLKCAQAFVAMRCPPSPVKFWNGERYNHSKIRIAYISPDFREHPVSHLMAGILEHHDKSRFEVFGFSLGMADSSPMFKRIALSFDSFFDVRQKGSREIAEAMRAMEIDIAIDLGGYTQDARPDILAYRPAPVQVNYLGYPGSFGAEYIDYILADKTVIPATDQDCYTENIVYLPGSYLPTDSKLMVAERTPEREEFGLPATGFIYCSFNHAYKIGPVIFDVWMKILKRTPGSVLWLMKLNSAAEINLRKEAERAGVDPDRLVFATRVPKVEDHLARYRIADLFLDTTPYNAHTTACDALFVGLPVLTYLGHAFPGRVAASLLNTIGLPELIAPTLTDYENLAVTLANDAPLLKGLRDRLAVNRQTSQLFNTAQFCENLEFAYSTMWGRTQRGEGHSSFQINRN
ncbi:MAG: tetratricopeptide repeat protein [Desulfuromonadaceae bacterium]|nr:tetratricopeptide repeat protein [Desulfuromonadaceae bacterium]